MTRLIPTIYCFLAALLFSGAASPAADLQFRAVSGPAEQKRTGVHIETDASEAALRLVPEEGVWSASSRLWLKLDVRNRGKSAVMVKAELRAQGSPEWAYSRGAAVIPAGETGTVPVLIWRKIPGADTARLVSALGDLRAFPEMHQTLSWQLIDADALNELRVNVYSASGPVDCQLVRLYAEGDFRIPSDEALKEAYLPPMDRFGQARNADWPGKIHSDEELKPQGDARNFRRGFDGYGGWKEGPQLEATDHFYTAKRNGKWWLVDPEGHLFWSLGIAGIHFDLGWTKTPGMNRGNWNPYHENLARKYGADWNVEHAKQVHQRLHDWGFNTLGNWTGPEFYSLRKTPYVVAIHYPRTTLAGHEKMWGGELPDVFHPEFKERTLARLKQEEETAQDSWCIGYFIDNELEFQSASRPAEEALKAPDDVAARTEFLNRLREKYGTPESLNNVWETDFNSWETVRVPEKAGGGYNADLLDFSRHYYHTYYRICRDAVREAAPHKLYLGSRIPFLKNKEALSICAEYADVVSINLYDYTTEVLELPPAFDAPILIGEFHFGTPGVHGYWGGGLVNAESMEHAAELFKWYVETAAKNPQIVGAHWFQYHDQPISGRLADGENHRIGFVDVTDRPYPEMVKAARDAAEKIYLLRE